MEKKTRQLQPWHAVLASPWQKPSNAWKCLLFPVRPACFGDDDQANCLGRALHWVDKGLGGAALCPFWAIRAIIPTPSVPSSQTSLLSPCSPPPLLPLPACSLTRSGVSTAVQIDRSSLGQHSPQNARRYSSTNQNERSSFVQGYSANVRRSYPRVLTGGTKRTFSEHSPSTLGKSRG